MSSLCHTALPKHTSFTSPPFTVPLMHTQDSMMFLQHFQGHSGLKAFGSCCSNILFLQITAQPISSPVTSYSLCSSATFFQIPKQPTPSPPSHNLWSCYLSVFFFLAVPRGLWDLSSPTWGRTCASYTESMEWTSGPPGKSLVLPFLWGLPWSN